MTEQRLGDAVRLSRKARGIGLREMARDLGVSPATVSAIEHDKVSVTVERLRAISELLNTTPEALLRGEVRQTSEPPGLGDWRDYGESTLDPILEASASVFVQRGFHAATMRAIAEKAGLSVPGVYHHYASKQSLLVILLELMLDEIMWRLIAARDEAPDDPVMAFANMVESLALFHAKQANLALLGASEMRAFKGQERDKFVERRDEVQRLLNAQADLCCSIGAFNVARPRVAARAVATLCTSLPTWFRDGGELTAEQVAVDYASYAVGIMTQTA